MDTILSVQPKEGSRTNDGETCESVVYRMVDDLTQKMPRDYVDYEVKEALERMGPFLPMNIFLRQEVDCMQCVIRKVVDRLRSVHR